MVTFGAAVKNIVLTGFGHITLLDLDTIDLSNLNRQFLFRKKDVKQSKAMVCLTGWLPYDRVQRPPFRLPHERRRHSIQM